MQWVYSLLRNNQETGPYTFNELLDQHLRPTDLIWVEGRSQAWCYPSEVPELKSYFEGTAYQRPVAPAPQQISSLPDEIEQRAEELRQRVLSFTPKYYSPKTESKSTTYSDTLYVIEEGKIHFVDHRKKEVPAYEWLSAAMVTFLVVAGIYGGHRLLSSGTTLLPTVASKAVTVDDHEAKVVAKKINQPVVTANYTESAPDSIYTDSALMKSDSVQTKQSAGTKLANRRPAPQRLKVINIEQPAIVAKEEEMNSSVPMPEGDTMKKTEAEVQAKAIVSTETADKKKSFGQVIKGLFKKKKHEEDKAPVQDSLNTASN